MNTPPSKDWFINSRFGMFIHWGLYALPARGEWVKKHEVVTEEKYDEYFAHFDPDRFDPRAWARQARAAGMRYVVLTAKHHDGFCLWDSEFTDYKCTSTPYGKDLLAPFVEAFREEGLRVGLYYSLIDWHHPHFTIDRMHPRSPRSYSIQDFEAANEGRDMAIYRQYMRDQVGELLTNFGEISLLWFDFTYGEAWDLDEVPDYDVKHGPGPGKTKEDWGSEALWDLVHKLQPQCLVNNRLGLAGEGDFLTPEQVQPNNPPRDAAGQIIPWEGCQTFSGAWGYEREAEQWKSSELLLWMLVDSVSKGGNLLLNVGPNGRGEFEPKAIERLADLAEWMRLHSRAIHGCGSAPAEIRTPTDCRLTFNATTNRLYIHILRWPFRHLHFEGMAGRIAYAQFLNDASEVPVSHSVVAIHEGVTNQDGHAVFLLPTTPPPVAIPVIEVFLSEPAS